MGSEGEFTENEKPTQTDQPDNQLHCDDSPENRANSYEAVTNKPVSYGVGIHADCDVKPGIVQPHLLLPIPVPPEFFRATIISDAPPTFSAAATMPSIGSYLRQRSNDLSAAITKRVSSFRQEEDDEAKKKGPEVTEFSLAGVKVVVQVKPEEEEPTVKGRISFFSRSGCRDCTAVRRFFREKRLKFVEINVDVYRERENELRERTGSATVPHIFFNEKLIGGLVELNSLRNNGEFEQKVAELVAEKLPGDDAPAPPVYGYDAPEEVRTDEMAGIVGVLRQRLVVQDRWKKMKVVKNCFDGNELVAVVVQHLNCARNEVRFVDRINLRIYFTLFIV